MRAIPPRGARGTDPGAMPMGRTSAECSGGDLLHVHRLAESVRSEDENLGCGLAGLRRRGPGGTRRPDRRWRCRNRARLRRPGRAAEDRGKIGPELVVAVPGDPVRGPARLGVGGEHGGAAQAILPAFQQRLLAVDAQNHLRRRLGDEAHIALERRRFVHAHAVQNFGLLASLPAASVFRRRWSRCAPARRAAESVPGLAGSFRKYDLPPANCAIFSR